jgi:hypothetical protein
VATRAVPFTTASGLSYQSIGNRDSPHCGIRYSNKSSRSEPVSVKMVKRKPSDEVSKLLGCLVALAAYLQSSQKSLIVAWVVSYRTYTSRSAAIPFLCCTVRR